MNRQLGSNILTPPAPFGRYQLTRLLGSGGMATVYRAELHGAGGFTKPVALKVFHLHLTYDPEFAPWFISEARLGGYLSHPNIVETLDFGEQDGRLFLAMEYVNGPTLENVLTALRTRQTPPPLDVAIQLMVQVCQGLDYAHRATDNQDQPLKMVHRDLKPSNILLTRHGQVKLADFGVARAESNLVHTMHSGMLKGTVRYMSPEQAWGKRDLDHRSDIFALGMILFELLTLKHIYEGDSREVVLRHAQDAVIAPRLVHVPEGPARETLMNMLMRTLAADRTERYDSALTLAEELQGLLSGLGDPTPLRAWLSGLGPEVIAPPGSSTGSDGKVRSEAPLTGPPLPPPRGGVGPNLAQVGAAGRADPRLAGGGFEPLVERAAPTGPTGSWARATTPPRPNAGTSGLEAAVFGATSPESRLTTLEPNRGLRPGTGPISLPPGGEPREEDATTLQPRGAPRARPQLDPFAGEGSAPDGVATILQARSLMHQPAAARPESLASAGPPPPPGPARGATGEIPFFSGRLDGNSASATSSGEVSLAGVALEGVGQTVSPGVSTLGARGGAPSAGSARAESPPVQARGGVPLRREDPFAGPTAPTVRLSPVARGGPQAAPVGGASAVESGRPSRLPWLVAGGLLLVALVMIGLWWPGRPSHISSVDQRDPAGNSAGYLSPAHVDVSGSAGTGLSARTQALTPAPQPGASVAVVAGTSTASPAGTAVSATPAPAREGSGGTSSRTSSRAPTPSATPRAEKVTRASTPAPAAEKAVEATAGLLCASSRPASSIRLDGRVLQGFPIRDLRVSAGRHRLGFELEGQVVEQEVVVEPNATLRCNADLRAAQIACRQDR